MLTKQLRKALVKAGYARFLVLGAILGVATVIVVLCLFANYYRAVQLHLTGLHAHVSLHKAQLSDADFAFAARAIEALGTEVIGHDPAIDVVVEAEVTQVEARRVVCAREGEQSGCFFDEPTRFKGWPTEEAFGFTLERSRVGALRLRGITVGDQGDTLLDLQRVLDVSTSPKDLVRLREGVEEGGVPKVLFERTFFHGALPLDDFLLEIVGSGPRRHVQLLSSIHLGLERSRQPVLVTSLEQAQRFLGGAAANTIDVRLRQPGRAQQVAEQLRTTLSSAGFTVRSWRDEDAGSFRLLGVLRNVIVLVISSVVAIAALSIASTLSLVVVESRRTIAMLRALGLRDRGILVALLGTSARIAAFGLVGGTLLGVAGSALLLRLQGLRDGLSKMGIREPDVILDPVQLVVLAALTLVLFLAVAWAPARAACRIDPVAGLTQ